MPESNEKGLQEETAIPRREFIRKSLVASGGLFVGMSTLGKVSLPELTADKRPRRPSSRDDDDDDREKDKDKGKGGRFGGYRS